VFIILSWLIGIGVVMTGGAIIGSWYVARDFSFLRWVRRVFRRGTEADGTPEATDGRDGGGGGGAGEPDAGSPAPTQSGAP